MNDIFFGVGFFQQTWVLYQKRRKMLGCSQRRNQVQYDNYSMVAQSRVKNCFFLWVLPCSSRFKSQKCHQWVFMRFRINLIIFPSGDFGCASFWCLKRKQWWNLTIDDIRKGYPVLFWGDVYSTFISWDNHPSHLFCWRTFGGMKLFEVVVLPKKLLENVWKTLAVLTKGRWIPSLLNRDLLF